MWCERIDSTYTQQSTCDHTHTSVMQPANSNTRAAPGVPCLTWALFWSQQPARRVGMISNHHDIKSTVGSQIPMADVHSGRPSSGLVAGLGSNRTPYRKHLSDTPEKMNLPSRGIFYVHIHGSTVYADGRRTSERLWTFVSVKDNCFFWIRMYSQSG